MTKSLFVSISGMFLILLGIIGMAASGYGALLVKKTSEAKLTLSLTEALTELNLDIIEGKDKTQRRLNKSSSNIESAGAKIEKAGEKINSAASKMKTAGEKLNSTELVGASSDFAAASDELKGASGDIKEAGSDLNDAKESLTELLTSLSSSVDSTIQGTESMARSRLIKNALYAFLGYLFLIHFVLFITGASLLMVSSGEEHADIYRERERDEDEIEEAEEVLEDLEGGIEEES